MKNIIVIFSIIIVLIISCIQQKQVIVSDIPSIECTLLGDWYVDSTNRDGIMYIQMDKVSYTFTDNKIYIIEGDEIYVSYYLVKGDNDILELYTPEGILIDRAYVMKLNYKKLVLKTDFYVNSLKTVYLSK